MRILTVDDSPVIQGFLKAILEAAGYRELLSAVSARDAFKQLGMDDPIKPNVGIDLILMDIMMPEINGIEACRRIKAVERLQDIPIIMVTAESEVENLQAAFDAGAIDYIAKPLNKVTLLARVRSALRLKQEMDRRKARERELLEVSKLLEEANQSLWLLSSLDGLTGVANRRHFDEALNHEWRRAMRDVAPLSLIMIDVDFFKIYNDTYGHQSGDNCLKQVAGVLSSELKRAGDLAARYGGEEFAVILPMTHAEGAVAVAEAIRARVEALGIEHARSKVSDRVTISLGVTTVVPDRDSSIVALIAAADRALYQAKHEGRNRVKSSHVTPDF